MLDCHQTKVGENRMTMFFSRVMWGSFLLLMGVDVLQGEDGPALLPLGMVLALAAICLISHLFFVWSYARDEV
jgi:hypothetical protein